MKKFFVFLLVVICLGMGAGVVYMKSSEDNEGPKITFEEGKDTNYTSDMTEEDLLKDVKAQDDRDGDVTESLTVEPYIRRMTENRFLLSLLQRTKTTM